MFKFKGGTGDDHDNLQLQIPDTNFIFWSKAIRALERHFCAIILLVLFDSLKSRFQNVGPAKHKVPKYTGSGEKPIW